MIVVAGFDYKNSSLGQREKAALIIKQIQKEARLSEYIVLSTCNRVEIYADCEQSGINYLKSLFPSLKKDKEAIEHCFRVACGLESMVIGENQILGQVKTAYENAIDNNTGGKALNRLFLDAITAAKRVKNKTALSSGNLSVASIGLKLLEEESGGMSGKSALILGLGKINQIVVQNLLNKELEQIYLINRSQTEIAFKDRYEYIDKVDFIISCTAAPHLIMDRERFSEIHSGEKPLYIMDLAVPRDIDPNIKDIPGIKLFTIDDLQSIAEKNYEKRLISIKAAEKIIKKYKEKYLLWQQKNTTPLCLTYNRKTAWWLAEEASGCAR